MTLIPFKDSKLPGYSMNAKTAKEAEVWIYEAIGGGWFDGVSASQFAKDIKALGDVQTITIHLNSPGGNVFDGAAIYNTLKQHRARVVMSIEGQALSAASVVAMAGDEINIAANAMMMIHDAWSIVIGSAADLRKEAEILDKVNGTIVTTYLSRVTLKEQQIIDMMSAETWMDAGEAIEYGFADQITAAMEAAAFDLSKFKYRNIPKQENAPEPLVRKGDDMRQKLAAMQMRSLKNRAAGTPAKPTQPMKGKRR